MDRRIVGVAVVATLLAAGGCDGRSSERAITHERIATVPSRPAKLDATPAERFDAGGHGMGGMGDPAGDETPRPRAKAPVAWDLPAGWAEKPDPSGMRVGSFGIESSPEADCSITLLPGAAGGVVANVNRWRKQMGLPEASAEAIEQLPRRPLLRQPAHLVELEGSYSGMDGKARESWKLLGALTLLEIPGLQPIMVFVKLTGPKATLDAERKNFEALCDSVRFAARSSGGHGPDDGHDHGAPPSNGATNPHGGGAAGPEPAPASLSWEAPQGWTKDEPRAMRMVTFKVGSSECYVSELPAGSGLAANLNRWRQQMGQPPLDDAAIAQLPRAKVLGQDVPVLEVSGTYTDVTGQKREGSALLGAAVEQGGRLVFIKMVGPESEVRAERDRFRAFVGSLK